MNDDNKKKFKELMADEKLQLPRRIDENYASSLCHLLDYYIEHLTCLDKDSVAKIETICDYIKRMAQEHHGDDVLALFHEMMEQTCLMDYLHIIKDELPIDGYAIKNANLFRIREYNENKNYDRKDIFHIPMSMNPVAKALRYNITGYPSLYLGSTIYVCCEEMGKGKKDRLIGSMYRFDKTLPENSLYIMDLGVRPSDYVKYVKYEGTGRRSYTYMDYLFVYPLIAACSFIAANKSLSFIKEYSISNALFRWLHLHKSDKICGVRYFSCAKKEYMIHDNDRIQKESDSKSSFTRYFINYALSIERNTQQFSEKLGKAFLITKPKIMQDYIDIKDFETNIKKDTDSLKHIFE